MATAAAQTHSYASDAAGSSPWHWLLFAQQKSADAFALTVVAHSRAAGDAHEAQKDSDSKRALYELQLDERGLRQHIEELGIEVGVSAFVKLLQRTLENRAYVDVAVADPKEEQVPARASLLLTYKFSETISRKGVFELPLVAADVPQQVVRLLADLHATPHQPVLTVAQKHQRDALASSAARDGDSVSASSKLLSSSTFALSSAGGASSQEHGEPLASTSNTDPLASSGSRSANAQVLKRRHVPSGTLRRKGPKGAKLAKQ